MKKKIKADALITNIKNVAIITDVYSPISREINLLLTNIGIETTNRKLSDAYQIEIISEIHNKRQLSINQDGRVNEYELVFTVRFKINSPIENCNGLAIC